MPSIFNARTTLHHPTPQQRTAPVRFASMLSFALIAVSAIGMQVPTQAQNAPKGNAASLSGPNLLHNGNFALEAASWMPQLMNGKASATLVWPVDAPPPFGAAGKVARFDIDAIDKERWHSQFYQDGVNLENNETYTLTFWARANQERLLSISANADEDDYQSIGLDHRVPITAQWRKYSLAFTAYNARKDHARICFMLGDALGRVELADVRLQKGAVAPSSGSNMLRNANFAEGMTSWQPLRVEAPAQATLQIVDTPPATVGGKVAHITVSEPGTQPWHVYFGQDNLALEEGGVYTVSFWAKSNRNRPLIVHSDIGQDDYHQTGLRHIVALTPDWNKFTFVFTPTNTGNSTGRIIFSAGTAVGDVDIAGVALQRGIALRVPKPVPAPTTQATSNGKPLADKTPGRGETRAHRSHPLLGTWQSYHKEEGLTGKEYQRYRFVFEANGSGSLQVANMTADPAARPNRSKRKPSNGN